MKRLKWQDELHVQDAPWLHLGRERDAAAAWLQGEGPDAASSLEVGTRATLLWRRMLQEEREPFEQCLPVPAGRPLF